VIDLEIRGSRRTPTLVAKAGIMKIGIFGKKKMKIRPSLIVVLVATVVSGFFLKLVDAQAFWVFATGLIIYWFKSRDESKRNGQ